MAAVQRNGGTATAMEWWKPGMSLLAASDLQSVSCDSVTPLYTQLRVAVYTASAVCRNIFMPSSRLTVSKSHWIHTSSPLTTHNWFLASWHVNNPALMHTLVTTSVVLRRVRNCRRLIIIIIITFVGHFYLGINLPGCPVWLGAWSLLPLLSVICRVCWLLLTADDEPRISYCCWLWCVLEGNFC